MFFSCRLAGYWSDSLFFIFSQFLDLLLQSSIPCLHLKDSALQFLCGSSFFVVPMSSLVASTSSLLLKLSREACIVVFSSSSSSALLSAVCSLFLSCVCLQGVRVSVSVTVILSFGRSIRVAYLVCSRKCSLEM